MGTRMSFRRALRAEWLESRTTPATFNVASTSDDGLGSLRQAIVDANTAPGLDTIEFDPIVFASTQSIVLTTGQITVSDHVTIQGPAAPLTLDGNMSSRIFGIGAGTPLTVSLTDLAFTNCKLGSGGGGAITAGDDTLRLTRCSFVNNSTALGSGGAVNVDAGGTIEAIDCRFLGNFATNGGALSAGGVAAVDGKLIVQRSTLTGNSAAFDGGAILADGYLLVADSTLSSNTSSNLTGGGGAIRQAAQFNSPPITVRNSTLSGNRAAGSGGAIRLFSSTGLLTIQNSTIVFNTASGANGGGVSRDGGTITMAIESCIIGMNSNPASPDLFSLGSVSATLSLIGSMTGITTLTADGFTTSNLGVDPLLGPLADNGGSTLTHLPATTSLARNMGANPAGLTHDQRGLARVSGGAPDIGAVEIQGFYVTNTNDAGFGSLRQAIIDIEAHPGADTIQFDPIVFASPQVISLLSALPLMKTDATIVGPGRNLLTIRRDPAVVTAFPILRFNATGSAVGAVSDLSVTGGGTSGIEALDFTLTLDRVGVSANSTSGGGGGIFANSCILTIRDSSIADNLAAGNGGGILCIDSSLTLESVTLSGNTTTGGRGGGLDSLGIATLQVVGSTISGNSAGNHGGGLYVDLSTSYQIRNSTITGNTTHGRGGGICVNQGIGTSTLTVRNSTITANKSNLGGGGLASLSAVPTVSLQSTIVFGNIHPGGPDIASGGNKVQASNSLIGSASGFSLTDLGGNLPFGTNPLLGPLSHNGGPTRTHALLSGSPCVDTGANPGGLTTDQRGPGFSRAVGKTDIGAFEVQPAPAKVIAIAINGGNAQRSRVTTITVTFDNPPGLPPVPANAFQLKRQSDDASVMMAATTTASTVTLTFTGGAVELGSLADGRYTLTILASQVSNLDGDGNGFIGDNFTLVGTPANGLFRLFGDADGDGTVNTGDFLAFRLAFLSNSPAFDLDNSGQVDAADFLAFRLNFLKII